MRPLLLGIAFVALASWPFSRMMAANAVRAEHPAPAIDAVEEDWELEIAEPDIDGVGPQVTVVMCPGADRTSSPFVVFDLNYRDQPSFNAGGLQVQAWSGENLMASAEQGTAQCATAAEQITWTQRLSITSGMIDFRITAGSSTTWGGFGDDSQLQLSFAGEGADLSAYSPTVSVEGSGVTWQSNRVARLVLARVRYYSNGELVGVDATPRVLLPAQQSEEEAPAEE